MLPRAVALWLLPRYAGGTLAAPLRGPVRAAIAADDVVGAAYAALRVAERPRHGGLSGGQKDLLLQNILAGLDAAPEGAVSTRSATSSTSTSSTGGAPGRWRAAPLASLTAAAACLGLFAVLPAAPAGDDLAARGTNTAPLGVRVRCLQQGVVVDDASAGARQTGADLDCPVGGLLAFSTTNLQGGERFAFVIGIDDDGGRVWLPPFGPGSEARALPAGSADAVVDTLAPVPASAPQGVTLFVLLDDAPFTAVDVERRLAGATRGGLHLGRIERLPLDVDAQGRLLLRAPASSSPR